jgi:DNA-binding CsgD family transcriptional regulator/PAS domain-containing protein
MPLASLKKAIACLRDSAAESQVWTEALPLICDSLGAIGAACFARNDETDGIEWVSICGPLSHRTADYIEYYASIDIYRPVVSAGARAGWLTLVSSMSQGILGQSEWYQDFILPAGLVDVVSTQIHQAGRRQIIFGIHHDRQQSIPPAQNARLHSLLPHLQEAARLEQERRSLDLRASLGTWTLDRLGDAMFVAYSDGRIIEMNGEAERIYTRHRALTIRRGKLVATDAAEAQEFAALVAEVGNADLGDPSARRMLIGRADSQNCQLVTVLPFKGSRTPYEPPIVVIRVAHLLNQETSRDADFGALFGLSPAEERLARGLVQGRTLQQLTADFGVQMPTLRAQLRSVLRKCGVQRQVDLMRVLLRTL